MLPAKFRLKDKKEFASVFRRGKVSSNDVLIMKYSPAGPDQLKIGFSAGSKLSKKSSERNKAKRWMREAVRLIIGRVKPGHKIIFSINSKFPYKQMDYTLVQEKIRDLLQEARLFK
ncbi:MAG: ribonuclease P protein component [Candidatus Moranbacteria bacterium RBG_13_45_13]|nr:MAG: ribonuclease P protein component [Candidatus Moranbacteria bacterium RBG_13_45_13]